MDAFARDLIAWFKTNGRHDLPWQRDATPYSVWVSEIMLQQTRVTTVVPYFLRFMARFPAVDALAKARLDEVLTLWSGLGYYARARNLHRAARTVVEEFDGRLPESLDALLTLPGIGRSTAGAILALARGQRFAILDGNVKRVLARYHAVAGWAGKAEVKRRLWELAEAHTPTRRVADYTQAIMDLGATVCLRRQPICAACPLGGGCAARLAGTQDRLPAPRPSRERRRRSVRVLLVRDDGRRVLLERRPASGIWGGLFSFPELGVEEEPDQWCDLNLGVPLSRSFPLAALEHSFTHFDLRLDPLVIDLAQPPRRLMERDDWLWYNPAEELDVGVAAPIATLLASLADTQECYG